MQKSQLEGVVRRKEAELERLQSTVEARKAEQSVPRRLKGEDRIEELERELANDRRSIGEVDRQLGETGDNIRAMEGPKPPQPQAPSPVTPGPEMSVGELNIPANPVKLTGTQMRSGTRMSTLQH